MDFIDQVLSDFTNEGAMEVLEDVKSEIDIRIESCRMNEYIEYNRQNNLFFDENTDEELVKFREKLERKKLECAECQKRLEQLVEKRRNLQKID